MIPPPYPVLIYLMCASFFLGMLFYRTVHVLVMRHVRRKENNNACPHEYARRNPR